MYKEVMQRLYRLQMTWKEMGRISMSETKCCVAHFVRDESLSLGWLADIILHCLESCHLATMTE